MIGALRARVGHDASERAAYGAAVNPPSGTFRADCRFAGTFDAGVKSTPPDLLSRQAPGTRDLAELALVDAEDVLDLERLEGSELLR